MTKKLVAPFYRMLVKTDEVDREEAKQSMREALVTFAEVFSQDHVKEALELT